MGHLYVKENETFSTSRNGTVPKPTAADVSANKILQADGTWVNNSGGGGALDDLTDVSISSPVAGHTLVYNEDDNEWQNTFLEEKMCLANVSGDVFIDNPAQGEVLTYDGSTWINAEPPSGGVDELTELTDVDIDTPLDGHVLAYDALSDKWKNAQPSGGADSLNDLTDVGITSAADGQILKYNSITHRWENTNESGGTVTDVKVNGTSVVSSGEALIKSYKELTQAQYDALPSSKLTDGVLYCITDDGYVEGQKFAPVIYSTEERQIGTWIDGKPLYQKTINYGDITNGNSNISLTTGLTNINKMFIVPEASQFADSIPVPYVHYSSLNLLTGYFININNGVPSIEIRVGSDSKNALTNTILTIRYTKTTDIPGSGRWGSNGIPTHHYSESEQVIGTWVNGKPLYEKILHVTAAITSGSTQVYHYISNLGDVISISGRCRYNSTSEMLPIPYVSSNSNYFIQIGNVDSTKFTIYPGSGFTSLNDVYITLQYTKSTD